ncbi:integrase domain-containing protein [Paraburkholderia agricolaris]|uniref:Integrase domain-containing protein n=1 Tax=Paraburkholderia agricolaris TaxID=2152888 RepID=A0ABW8ZVV5_9BURK
MAAVLNVRAVVKSYGLPPEFTDALLRLLDDHVNEVHSRTRISAKSLSVKTQERRTTAICKSFVELRQHGFALQTPWSLKQKHVEFLVRHWVALGQRGGTIENKLTYLRALASWMNKRNLVGTLGDYVDRKEKDLVRSYVATEDKSWIAHRVDAQAKIAEIGRTCPHVAVQLKMQAAFGLRVEESFMLRPAEAVRDSGRLGVTRGTKGGRPREVPIEAEFAVLEEAARLSNDLTGSTVPADRTLRQWRDWYYYVLEKHGVTKAGLGITSHGLRHEYLQTLYETTTGVPAPVKALDARPDLELHLEALRRVVADSGHSRRTKANAYLSTFAHQERQKKITPTIEQAHEALQAAEGNKSRAASMLGISRQALYRLLSTGP